jgi:adenylate cyclase
MEDPPDTDREDGTDGEADSGAPAEPRRLAKARELGTRVNRDPRLIRAVRVLREILPGDSRFGDPLSTAGAAEAEQIGRQLSTVSESRPGVLREAGLSALQVWQAIAQAGSGGGTPEELTIVFTDLVGYSDWSLGAGDEATIELLREVALAIEPPVSRHRGRVVKRLGDGMMAVFSDPAAAYAAVQEAVAELDRVSADGYRPELRAGIHHGEARLLGGDYFGADVNIAARLAEHAGRGEVLVSGAALERLPRDSVTARRKRLFRGKGVPRDLEVYAIAAPEP